MTAFLVEAHPSVVKAIVQRHRGIQKLFDHYWAHLLLLDFRSGKFYRYEPTGQWQSVPTAQPAYVA